MLGVANSSETRLPPQMPREFKALFGRSRTAPFSAPFWNYLEARGFSAAEASWAAERFRLHYALRGSYRYRIIVPVYDERGRLASWTARSILADAEVRYKALLVNPRDGYNGPLALCAPGQLLLDYVQLMKAENARVLALCEGPFDAIRISTLGHRHGIYGTCLFGLNITDNQVALLETLLSRFQRLVLLLDPDAALLRLRIRDYLGRLPVSFGVLPEGVEDPGALMPKQAAPLFQTWLAS
jgi:hypothetical protein